MSAAAGPLHRSAPEQGGDSVLQLTGLGLTTYEAKAYLALVKRDASSAAEAARVAQVPRQRIYDVLDSLIEKGLATMRPAPVTKYSAAPPERALERLLACRRAQLAASEQSAAALLDVLSPAYEAGRQPWDSVEPIEVLRERSAIRDRFAQLRRAGKRELLVFAKLATTPIRGGSEPLDLARSCLPRTVYQLSALERDVDAQRIRGLLEAGEEARFVRELPLELAIVDAAIVAFAIEGPVADSAGLTTVVVEHHALAQVLKLAFEAVWHGSLSFDEARAVLSS